LPLGKTVYKYNIGNINPNDEDVSSGDLLESTVYDITGKILDDELNTYSYPAGDGGLVGRTVAPANGQDDKSILCQSNQGGNITYSWLAPGDPATSCTSTRSYKTKYVYSGYAVTGQYRQLSTVTKTTYDQQSAAYTVSTRQFTYGSSNHTLPTLIEQSSSSNDKIVTSKKYAGDYTVPSSGTLDNNTSGIQLLQTNNMGTAEVEVCQYRQNADGSNKRYIAGTLKMYAPNSPYLQAVYNLELNAPATTLQASTTNGTFTYDPAYRSLGSYNYDSYGNISEQSKTMDAVKSYIWDYFHSLPAAEVINANANMIAYTGFESTGTGGNWSGFNNAAIVTGGMGGNNSYNLSSGSLSITGLPATRQYVVSYWVHSGTVSVSSDIGGATGVSGSNFNGWTYFEHVLPANSTQAAVSSSAGANIDELRLFPKDALMVTYNFNPGIGLTGRCTPTNQFTFYTYDGFGRTVNIKDQAGNIVKNFKYNYGLGSPVGAAGQTLFYSNSKQGSFAKAGCPIGTEPTTETYVVPPGKYVSSQGQDIADAKAQTDVDNNGPTYANTMGQCLYWNTDQSLRFSKNDCSASEGGSVCSLTGPGELMGSILYDVPAHTYSSPADQSTANSLAMAVVTANGQNYANSNCWCSCAGEGKRVVNGTCERGVRYNSSTTQMPDGTWRCIYYYVFSDNYVSQNYTTYGTTPCSIR